MTCSMTRARFRRLAPFILALVPYLGEAGQIGTVGNVGQAGELVAVPHPTLGAMDSSVASQLEAARSALEEARQRRTNDDALASAYAELGKLYLAYDLVEAAAVALENASLLRSNFEGSYLLGVARELEGELEASRAAYDRALEIRAGDVPALVRSGRLALELGDVETGRTRFSAAAERDPASPAARFGLARVALADGEAETAIQLLEQVVRDQPSAGLAHYQLGLAYRQVGDRAKARAALERQNRGPVAFPDPVVEALASLRSGSGGHIVRAAAARAAGDLITARAAYEEALAADPTHGGARQALAATLLGLGLAEEAAREYQTVLEGQPADASARFNLGTILMRLGRIEDALPHLEAAVSLAPDFADARANLGTLLERLGRLEQATASYRASLELAPQDHDLRVQLARVLDRRGLDSEAASEIERVLAASSDHPGALFYQATRMAERGRSAEAIAVYDRLLDLTREPERRSVLHQRIAGLLRRSGRPAEALEQLEAAHAASTGPGLRLALANALAAAGRFDRAETTLAQLVAEQPENVEARFGQAVTRLLARRDRQALEGLEAGLAVFPEDVGLRHVLARLLAASEEAEIRNGRRALQLARAVYEAAPNPVHAETVAMALAELGAFEEAVRWQQGILKAVRQAGHEDLATAAADRLDLYRRGQPCRAPWLK